MTMIGDAIFKENLTGSVKNDIRNFILIFQHKKFQMRIHNPVQDGEAKMASTPTRFSPVTSTKVQKVQISPKNLYELQV